MKKVIVLGIMLGVVCSGFCFSGGDGTEQNPYQVSTREDLEAVNDYMGACYVMINDINLAGVTYQKAVIAQDTSDSDNSGYTGFDGTRFAGKFDGGGFTIFNLHISGGTNDYLAVFGSIEGGAVIKNLNVEGAGISGQTKIAGICGDIYYSGTIENCSFEGTITATRYAGGICGYNYYGTLKDCSSYGSVSEFDVGAMQFGGLCGYNGSGSLIQNCFSEATVSTDSSVSEMAGGLVGSNSGDIEFCYATGNVRSMGDYGGFVGSNSGDISNCYALGSVISGGRGSAVAGGFAGENSGEIVNSYSKGSVSSNYVNGGFCGRNSSIDIDGVINECFWDTQTSGKSTSDGGTGLNTSQMKDQQNFMDAGWDFSFEGTWIMSLATGYPVLFRTLDGPPTNTYTVTFNAGDHAVLTGGEASQEIAYGQDAVAPTIEPNQDWTFVGWDNDFTQVTSDLTVNAVCMQGSGSLEDPYQIRTLEDILVMNFYLDSNYRLMNDIDLEGRTQSLAIIAPSTGTQTDYSGAVYEGTPFTGTFDGNGFAISGFTVNGQISGSFDKWNYIGFFGKIGNGAVVKNLYLEDCEFEGNMHVGSICGYNEGALISDCVSDADVTGESYVGGLAGTNVNGQILRCCSLGSVQAWEKTGGLVGNSDKTSYSKNSTIENCYSFCSVSANGSYVGGLCGENDATISKSYSAGYVDAQAWASDIGGLCGNNWSNHYGSITNSFWDTDVSGQTISSGGTGLTTVQMKEIDNFTAAGWDFTNVWVMSPAASNFNGYPVFASQDVQINTYTVLLHPGEHGSITEANSGNDYLVVLEYGSNPPEINIAAETGYEFTGFSPELPATITEDFEATAQYELKTYVVTFLAGDHGSITDGQAVQNVVHGSSAAAPTVTADTGWIFSDWDTDFTNIQSDITVTALYEPAVTVTFDPGDHGTITSGQAVQVIAVGSDAAAPGITSEAGWVFVGWDISFTEVNNDITVTALYEVAEFTVTFLPGEHGAITDGLAEQIVIYGSSAQAPQIAADFGWVFRGWDNDFTNITSDITVTALYSMPGTGDVSDPYQIYFLSQLLNVNSQLQAHYKLINDIDLSGTSYSTALIAPDTDNSGLWTYEGTPFSGTFDGNGFSIISLNINGGGNDYIALFGMLGSSAIVKDLTLENCNISGEYAVAGIASENYGSIENCCVSGNLNGSLEYIGGIAAFNNNLITNSWFEGNVSGYKSIGGICGYNTDGTISRCYAVGNVNGSTVYIGGIAGLNESVVSMSFSLCDVEGGDNSTYVGGFVGQNAGSIEECYSSGLVLGVSKVDGFVGDNSYGTAQNCFWDVETSLMDDIETVDTDGMMGKSTEEMKDISTYTVAGWDFTNVWKLSSLQSEFNGYPVFISIQQAGESFVVTFSPGTHGAIIEGSSHQQVDSGSAADAPVIIPAFGYKCVGWDGSLENISGNTILTAQYEQLTSVDCSSADTDGDNFVGEVDLAALGNDWLSNGNELTGDIDGNLWVNAWDYAVLSDCWLAAISVELEISLVSGNNWVSFNVLPQSASLADVLAGYQPYASDGDKIDTAEGLSATYHQGAWYGTLQIFEPGKMYKIQSGQGGSFVVEGSYVDIDTQIELVSGWNWLGFTSPEALPFPEALSSLQLSDGDKITSQTGLNSSYWGGFWYGNLESLEPGKGYMLYIAQPQIFSYGDTQ